jgi:hypothetical protein
MSTNAVTTISVAIFIRSLTVLPGRAAQAKQAPVPRREGFSVAQYNNGSHAGRDMPDLPPSGSKEAHWGSLGAPIGASVFQGEHSQLSRAEHCCS